LPLALGQTRDTPLVSANIAILLERNWLSCQLMEFTAQINLPSANSRMHTQEHTQTCSSGAANAATFLDSIVRLYKVYKGTTGFIALLHAHHVQVWTILVPSHEIKERTNNCKCGKKTNVATPRECSTASSSWLPLCLHSCPSLLLNTYVLVWNKPSSTN
jgi:hypothetical protein